MSVGCKRHHLTSDFRQVTGYSLQNDTHFLPLNEKVSQHQLKLHCYEEDIMRGSWVDIMKVVEKQCCQVVVCLTVLGLLCWRFQCCRKVAFAFILSFKWNSAQSFPLTSKCFQHLWYRRGKNIMLHHRESRGLRSEKFWAHPESRYSLYAESVRE